MPTDLREIKRTLRQDMEKCRKDAQKENPRAAAQLCERFLSSISLSPRSVVAAYAPFKNEMDPNPLLFALADRGHSLCLPVVVGERQPLIFRAYTLGDPLEAGSCGALEPLPDREEQTPSVLLVPLLAFDRFGHRLGYGGGYYDRTIAILRKNQSHFMVFGLAFAAQEKTQVPIGHYDRRLDGIVTENEVIMSLP